MPITHQEARSLIQFRADQALNAHKNEILNAHLKNCTQCAGYANEIRETENLLRTTLQQHWNVRSLPIQVEDIKGTLLPSFGFRDLVTTRSALVVITMLFFVFGFLRFTSNNIGSSSSMTTGIPAIPTPLLLSTSTQHDFNNCAILPYEVQSEDTLKSIAKRFSISEESILNLNNLPSESVHLPVRLLIPICELTPTGTTHPPTFTNTPSLELITYTPG